MAGRILQPAALRNRLIHSAVPRHQRVLQRRHPLEIHLQRRLIVLTFIMQFLLQRMTLMHPVQRFHPLLQAQRNQQANRDRPQVDPELSPRVERLMWRMNFHCGLQIPITS